jgi:integrase
VSAPREKQLSADNRRVLHELTRELRSKGCDATEATSAAYLEGVLCFQRYLVSQDRRPDILAASRADVQDWLIYLATPADRDGAGRAQGSIRGWFASLRRVYNYAVAEEMIAASPMAGMTSPPESEAPIPVPDTGAIRAVLAAVSADKTWMGRRDEAIIRLFCQAGAPRASEMAGLLAADVDLDADLVTVRGKQANGREKIRQFPLEPKTARAFSRWARARARRPGADVSPWWFLGVKGRMTRSGMYQMTERRCAQAGVPRIHPHQFRHWSTDRMLDSGMLEGQVMLLNGWTTRKMIDRYGRDRAGRRAGDAARRAGIGAVL